jgi:hypothetical protein
MDFKYQSYEGGASSENLDATLVDPETGLVNNYNGSHLGAYLMGIELINRALAAGDAAQLDVACDVAKIAFAEPLQTYDGYLRAQFPAVADALISATNPEKREQVNELVESLRPSIAKVSEALLAKEPISLADTKSALATLKKIRVLFKDVVPEEVF